MNCYAPNSVSRRQFLQHSVAGTALWAANQPLVVLGEPGLREIQRPKVAAVFTEFRFRSHAYNILENFMGPYLFSGVVTDPGVDIVSFYADQFPADDMARKVAGRKGIALCDTIEQAICLDDDDVAVDAVLLIGEHGKYPRNGLGQVMYPRKQFFDAVVAPMKRSGKFVPVFNDKHRSTTILEISDRQGHSVTWVPPEPWPGRIPPVTCSASCLRPNPFPTADCYSMACRTSPNPQ